MARFLWTQRQDIGPGARLLHAMVYCATAERTLLHGGRSAASSLFADTWEWDGEAWTQVADMGPEPRSGHQLAYDSARDRVVLFGGRGSGTTVFADTWEWDGATWTQVEDTGPSPRDGHAMVYDTVRRRVVLFGGAGPNGTVLGDTWEWDGASWTQAADSGPLPCRSAALVFDGSVSLLFGGMAPAAGTAPVRLFRLTWEWNGKHWTARQDMGPSPRWGHAMTFDDSRERTILFGGLPVAPSTADASDRVLGDTWELLGNRRATRGGVQLASFTLNPDRVAPLSQTTAAVTLNQQAPAVGTTVVFSLRGHPIGIAEVVVQGGETAGQTPLVPPDLGYGIYYFEARTQPDGDPLTATLHIPLVRLISFTLDPDTVVPFGQTTAAVRLNYEAPAGGAEISLSYAPSIIIIAAGETVGETTFAAPETGLADFPIEARLRSDEKRLIGSVGGDPLEARFVSDVKPLIATLHFVMPAGISLASFTSTPDTVTPGQSTMLRVGLSGVTPMTLYVAIDDPAASRQFLIEIPAGASVGEARFFPRTSPEEPTGDIELTARIWTGTPANPVRSELRATIHIEP